MRLKNNANKEFQCRHSSTRLHMIIKKYIIASIIILMSQQGYSNEWVAIGEQPKLLGTEQLEVNLWKYLEKNNKSKLKSKETYRFQYKYITKSSVFINALCLPVRKNESQPWLDGPTSEELRKEFPQVEHGGGCFFNIIYDLKKVGFNSLYVSLEE
jgi:hypothetical protein